MRTKFFEYFSLIGNGQGWFQNSFAEQRFKALVPQAAAKLTCSGAARNPLAGQQDRVPDEGAFSGDETEKYPAEMERGL
ncbi:hypothetical protein EFA69_20040 [Rufibacter immobilis]|uniref:Uncharacterized protein n=1 Tax=Rufibacter immobilis TaxID=1348778 RepID=A0A3M9MS36_9BACT|nr:hypothetical protein [Rufibacter immobilis]RNI28342.1 hypothetical protein EFA69_20040 [Rufibacter immobilis]